MKIDNSAKTNAAKGVAGARKNKPAVGQASPTSQTPRDSVQLNNLSSQLQSIEKGLADVSVVDTARVEEIKQAISEGRFTINSDAIADKLLSAAREMVLGRKG